MNQFQTFVHGFNWFTNPSILLLTSLRCTEKSCRSRTPRRAEWRSKFIMKVAHTREFKLGMNCKCQNESPIFPATPQEQYLYDVRNEVGAGSEKSPNFAVAGPTRKLLI